VEDRSSAKQMAAITKVTVLGGGRQRITTRDRKGATVERYEVRWRVHFKDSPPRNLRQRFDRAVEADAFVKRLQAVGLPGSGWELDDQWRPVDASTAQRHLVPDTMWTAVCAYRSATWRQASGNGRKSAAPALRALAQLTPPDAPRPPTTVAAYLDLVAFRNETEPDDLWHTHPDGVIHHGVHHTADDLAAGRRWLERWSLPVAQLTRTHIRTVVTRLGAGRSPATEGRRWTQVRAALR
jgi:hypothetical protein